MTGFFFKHEKTFAWLFLEIHQFFIVKEIWFDNRLSTQSIDRLFYLVVMSVEFINIAKLSPAQRMEFYGNGHHVWCAFQGTLLSSWTPLRELGIGHTFGDIYEDLQQKMSTITVSFQQPF